MENNNISVNTLVYEMHDATISIVILVFLCVFFLIFLSCVAKIINNTSCCTVVCVHNFYCTVYECYVYYQ